MGKGQVHATVRQSGCLANRVRPLVGLNEAQWFLSKRGRASCKQDRGLRGRLVGALLAGGAASVSGTGGRDALTGWLW